MIKITENNSTDITKADLNKVTENLVIEIRAMEKCLVSCNSLGCENENDGLEIEKTKLKAIINKLGDSSPLLKDRLEALIKHSEDHWNQDSELQWFACKYTEREIKAAKIALRLYKSRWFRLIKNSSLKKRFEELLNR